MDVNAEPTRQPIRFRGRSYVAFVFSPAAPIVNWLELLDTTLARSPGFFVGKPVVLDLSALDLSTSAIAHLVKSIEARDIRILGIEGVDTERLSPQLPPLVTGGRNLALSQVEPKKPAPKPAQTSLLLENVRSGQSIVFPDGDVTVLGSVSSGAEIVAGGSIHVYGTLRGRAMAGVNGNSAARIYCQRIEAELLAIDGYYQTAEELDASLRSRPVQAWLEGEIMRVTPLN
ncbi:septum site-determining protein MinC [Bradyrhizobium sp.]|jgi:septum site-determining protein MinC|uniref:septum site-determining protein MinC n=1 Tax=Bradyrhizobium sp. TaxID=376 RepID=UPI002B6282CA|nr:septum site-determining protein MinC [Bradyrhizobium sp.]HWX61265.1 septum site-determining protein MinC [Bradyrhizobium sp.]